MKAIQIKDYGDASALMVAELPTPAPAAGQVRIDVRAASVNPFDVKVRNGWLRGFFPLPMPYTLGTDFAGVVSATGDGVTTLAVGDRVFGMLTPMQGGTYAQQIVIDERLARRAPAGLSDVDAAALPLVGVTALIAVAELARVERGQRVLVHGAGGGVGGAAVMLAKDRGATVIATCGTDKCELVRSLGADVVIDYTSGDFCASAGIVDVVIDTIGGDTNLRSYQALKRGGTMVVVLRNDQQEMSNRERLSQQHEVAVKEVAYDLRPDLLDTVRELAERGALKANVQTVLPLAQAAEAHRMIESGHTRGKIVLKIG